MGDYFHQLLRELAEYHVAVDAAYLHGLLSGCATIPEMDSENLIRAIAGEQPLAESVVEAVRDNINSLAENLAAHEFQARFHGDTDGRRWLDGYFEAVRVHEKDWQDLNELHLKAGSNLIMLHTMRDAKLHRDLKMDLPGPKDLKQDPQLVSDLVSRIYEEFHGDSGGGRPLLDISNAELSAMDEAALMAIVTSSDDVLTFDVVLECASRGEAMVPLLRQHLEDDARWGDGVDESDWWGLLHAILILGLIPGEASAESLLDAFRRVTVDGDNDLSDWLSSCWPALCRNKTDFTTVSLQHIAEDRSLRWYPRCQAIDCVLAAAAKQGDPALEKAIDWLAAMSGDAANDTEFRIIAGHGLFDFPRERHRAVMETLVDLQDPGSLVDKAYTREDIQHSFDVGDSPEWHSFDNPWQFYDPDEIERRGLRESRDLETAHWDSVDYGSVQPYLRHEPKIGRNDPCPCGSGKKYKKCCLNAPR